MSDKDFDDGTHGAFILWIDYGYEGWHPYSYDTFKAAVDYAMNRASSPCVITGPVLRPQAPDSAKGKA